MTMTDPADPVVEALRKIAQHWQLMYGAPCTLSAELARDALPLAEANAARVRELEEAVAGLGNDIEDYWRPRVRELEEENKAMARVVAAARATKPFTQRSRAWYGTFGMRELWAALDALDHPGKCNGCGAAWNPADHVYGQRACCPECDHPGKDEG